MAEIGFHITALIFQINNNWGRGLVINKRWRRGRVINNNWGCGLRSAFVMRCRFDFKTDSVLLQQKQKTKKHSNYSIHL